MVCKEAASDTLVENRQALVRYAAHIVGDPHRAEDVVQDAWLRLNRVLTQRGDIGQPGRYAFRIVRNLALDERRRLRREQRFLSAAQIGPQVASVCESGPCIEREVSDREDAKRLVAALAGLPERTRTALIMHRIEGRRLREIAAHLGLSTSRVHGLVVEGLEHCKRRLD
ncbi:MAG: sigma-70 family RNA polymerase sigma factor [Pseudomonadota bacterium]